MRDLLLLCTKHVHFIFKGKMYIQLDGVAMRSPLGTLLVNIFMSMWKEHLIPTLGDCLPHWKRYVDSKHANINPKKLNYSTKALNNYH